MKQKTKVLVIIIISIALAICVCNLGMEKSYKDFYVEKIGDYEVEEYFASEELNFAQVDDVTIVPCIYATNHGEYTIDVKVYSQTGKEQVIVKSISARDGENVFYKQETEQEATFRELQNGIFEGRAKGGFFYETDVDLSSKKKLYVTVQVQVGNDEQRKNKEIDYEITIVQYWSHVMPT